MDANTTPFVSIGIDIDIDAQPADDNTLPSQQIAQHPRTGEGIVQMQFIDPARQSQFPG